MNDVEERLRDALAAEAEQYQASADLWRRVTEARVPRGRRIAGSALALAASAAVVIAFIAYRAEHPQRVTLPPEPITGATLPSTVICPGIGFTPNTEDMASDIRATGTDCIEASALIRQARTKHNFYSGPRAFELGRWRCTVVTEDLELPVGHYTCVSGTVRITWTKT